MSYHCKLNDCGKHFGNKSKLMKHQRTEHPENWGRAPKNEVEKDLTLEDRMAWELQKISKNPKALVDFMVLCRRYFKRASAILSQSVEDEASK